MTIFDDIRKDREAGTQGDWSGFNMTHADGRAMTPEELGEYVTNSVKMSKETRFLFVSEKSADGPDICHVGNGPKGPANTTRIARVPQLEAISLAAEGLENWLDIILTLVDNTSCEPDDPDQFDEDLLAAKLAIKSFHEACK